MLCLHVNVPARFRPALHPHSTTKTPPLFVGVGGEKREEEQFYVDCDRRLALVLFYIKDHDCFGCHMPAVLVCLQLHYALFLNNFYAVCKLARGQHPFIFSPSHRQEEQTVCYTACSILSGTSTPLNFPARACIDHLCHRSHRYHRSGSARSTSTVATNTHSGFGSTARNKGWT